jgi:hypothetical protein
MNAAHHLILCAALLVLRVSFGAESFCLKWPTSLANNGLPCARRSLDYRRHYTS